MEQHTNNLNGTTELHPIRTLHLFAGAGGGILADLLLGHQPICAVEIDQHCQQVLSQRQKDGALPWFPIFEDVTTFDGRPWRGLVEAVCGGFPCQDISSAGSGAGINGERSGLWSEMARIIFEVEPWFVFVENSPMLTVRGIGRVLGELATMGYDARWGVIGASDAAWHKDDPIADHERYRIWILAVSNTKSKRCAEAWRLRCDESEEWFSSIRPPIPNTYGERQQGHGEYFESFGSTQDGDRKTDWTRADTWWSTEPGVCGVANGVANGVDRLRAIGNGQVPAVAELAWNILKP